MVKDPVCGMAVESSDITLTINRQAYFFFSEECRNRFRISPERYWITAQGSDG